MVINTTVPVQSADKSDMASTKQAVTLVVKLTKAGLEVNATGSAQTPEELAAVGARFDRTGDAPDYAKFTEHLVGLKQKYPKSETMILIPEPGTRYEDMVRTMDAAREKEVKAGGKLRLVRLFPNVVISTVVK
jgi:hypothetical protein